MSGADQLFEIYRAGGLTYLQSLVGKEVETQIQDFKLLEKSQPPMSKGDKGTYAKALSGFANSDGGVIVWGVDCRKDSTGADVVQPLRPLPQLTVLISDLNTLCSSLVSPGVATLSIPILDTGKIDDGWVVTLVPRGDSEPVQAVGSNHEFRYRAGGAFLPMPQWMVSDRFGRRPHPKVELRIRKTWSQEPPNPRQGYALEVINTGFAIARDLCLVIDHSQANFSLEALALSSITGFSAYGVNLPRKTVMTASINRVLHPSLSIHVAEFRVDPTLTEFANFEFYYELYCDGFSSKGIAQLADALPGDNKI